LSKNNGTNSKQCGDAAVPPVNVLTARAMTMTDSAGRVTMTFRILGDDRKWYRHKRRYAVQTRLDEYV